MNDLLAGSPGHPRISTSRNEPNGADIESGILAGDAEMGMPDFFQEVAEIKTGMVEIRNNLRKLEEAHEETKTVTKAAAMKALKQRMESDVDEVTRIARIIKQKLEELDEDNISNRKRPGCVEGSSIDRTRTSMTAILKRKLKDLMGDFQSLRKKFQDEHREVVERRVFTVTGKKADEEVIEQLIETGDSESIFQKAIQEQGYGQILDTVAEIQERHDAVRDMEERLLELHQVFLDMAVLVEAQGELLDNIENQVSKAVEHVEAGSVALRKAGKAQRSSRKWLCTAIIVLLVIILIMLATVIKPWEIKA